MQRVDNASVRSLLLNRATATAWLTGLGVLLSGVADWLQGVAPEGIVELPSGVGLALFVIAVLGAVIFSVIANQRPATGPDRRLQFASIAFAAVAAGVGDPTYSVLLFAVPLIEVAQRRSDEGRRRIIAAIFTLAAVLVALENPSWAGNELEATLIVFIALLITTMLGDALGRLDDARRLETDRARVDERQHLARELHDSVGHSLLAGSIQLRNAEALWDREPDRARAAVALAGSAVDEALVDTRFAVDRFRSEREPFDLEQALHELVRRAKSPALDLHLALLGDIGEVDQVTQMTLYRVAQEALTNAMRHADATRVEVTHCIDQAFARLQVSDNGSGFDPSEGAPGGLRNLAERLARVGGSLDVTSSPQSGTTVVATVGRHR